MRFPSLSYHSLCIRAHKKIRDRIAKLSRDICFDVELERKFQPFIGESFQHKTMTKENQARFKIKDKQFARHPFQSLFWRQRSQLPRAIMPKMSKACKYHETEKHKKNKMLCFCNNRRCSFNSVGTAKVMTPSRAKNRDRRQKLF